MEQKTLYIKINNACNMNCNYCYNKLSKLDSEKPDFEALYDIIDNNEIIYHFAFMGGEPFLYKDEILEVLKRIKKRGASVTVNFLTNGTIYIKELRQYRDIISSIQISVDGWRDVNDNYRKFVKNEDGTYETIIKNIKRYYRDGITLKINSVIANPKSWSKSIGKMIEDIPSYKNISISTSLPVFEKRKRMLSLAKAMTTIIRAEKRIQKKYKDFEFHSPFFSNGIFACPQGKNILSLDLTSLKIYPCPVMIGMQEGNDQVVGKAKDGAICIEESLENSISYTKIDNYKINFLPKKVSKFILKRSSYAICYLDNKIATGDYFTIPITNTILSFIVRIMRKRRG